MRPFVVFVFAGTAVASFSASATADSVPRWEPYEVILRTGRAIKNPFLDVRLGCTFARGERRVSVEGFYDGKDGSAHVYRIRFAPDEEGTWRYTTASDLGDLDRKSGSLTVTAPVSPGGLVRRPELPRSFFRADGSRFFIVNWGLFGHYNSKGGSDFPPKERVIPFPAEDDMRAFIDVLGEHQINMFMDERLLYLRAAHLPDPSFYPPYEVKDAATWKINRDHFNLAYFQRLDRELAHAKQRGVFYQLQILSSQLVQGGESTWPNSFLNEKNGGWLRDRNGDDDADDAGEYYDLGDARHVRNVGALLRYTLARTAPYWNVMYRIGGDTRRTKAGEALDSDGLIRWYTHWFGFVRAHEPYHRPMTIGRQPGEIINAVGSDWNPIPDFSGTDIKTCGFAASPLKTTGQRELLRMVAGRGECFWLSPDFSRPVIYYESDPAFWERKDHYEAERKAYWVAMASGYHWARPDQHAEVMVSSDPPRLFESRQYNLTGHPPLLADLKRMGEFLKKANLEMERMAPFHRRLVERSDEDVYVLANPGSQYLALFPFGGSANLRLGPGRYEAQFFNPRDGSYGAMVPVGGGTQRFQAPSADDWVLVVRKT